MHRRYGVPLPDKGLPIKPALPLDPFPLHHSLNLTPLRGRPRPPPLCPYKTLTQKTDTTAPVSGQKSKHFK